VNAFDAPVHDDEAIELEDDSQNDLVQLHHKIRTFKGVNKHLVLVVQDRLLDYMRRNFLRPSQLGSHLDPMHFMRTASRRKRAKTTSES
jgi:hypothetical protein